MDHPTLPFSDADAHEIRALYNFPFSLGPTDEILQYPVSVWKRGNYIAACIRRGLREEARKAMQHSFPVPRPQDISHLPNELLFEIFEKLHPLDLYHLCQTSKDLRKLLLNGEAFSHVWKAAYENYPTLPSCPQDVSLPKWTSLLFGPDSCDMCGAEYAMTDIAFRARYCDNCMDEYYFTRSDLRRVIQTGPNYYGAALSLARSSTRSSGVNYTKHESKRFLRSDVERICQQMQKRAANMELGALAASIDSSREFSEFLEHKTHTRECNKWCRTQYTLCERVHETTTEALARRFVSHKFAKRFDPQDLFSPSVTTSLYELFLYSGVRKLRGPTFRSSLTSISKIFSDARVLRLESERTQREHARCKRIHDEFDGYMATMPARNWTYLPLCGRVFNHPIVQAFVFSETVEPGPGKRSPTFNEVVCELKRFIVTCFEDHQRDLQAALERFDAREPDPVHYPATVDRIVLATTIFVCPVCQYKAERLGAGESVCIGRRELGLHANCWDPESLPSSYDGSWNVRLKVSPEGTKAADFVVGLLGLDGRTTAAEKLDEINARFVCNTCYLDDECGASGRDTLTWRDCIAHQVKMADEDGHDEPSFVLLSEEISSCVRFHEQPFPPPNSTIWSCMRCTDHLASRVTRQTVIAHFKQLHSPYAFYDPIEDVDYFYFPQSYEIPARQKVRLPFNGPYRCMRCPEHLNKRLLSRNAVHTHLKDKHGVRAPAESDWKSVEVENEEDEEAPEPSETECYNSVSKFHQMHTINCL